MDQTQQVENTWLQARPKLRDDLVFAPRSARGRRGYVIEDPVRGKFFRLGLSEYLLVAALDGTVAVGEALHRIQTERPDQALSPQAAASLLSWLSSAGFLERTLDAAPRGKNGPAKPAPGRAPWWLNPIFVRVPLLHPDRLLDRLMPLACWVGSPRTIGATLLIALVSGLFVLPHSKELFASLQSVTSAGGAVGLLVCWVGLKVVHELGHGLVCRRYGASAREAGIMLLLFLPIPYIDVTSSWRLRDRWQRIHIAAAGMLIELLIASIAGLVWAATPPGVWNQLAANVVVMASLTTVLFNANPLMRFDGYYILSDVLDVPNLYGQSQAWLRGSLRRRVLGLPTPVQQLPAGLERFTQVYGVAALIWRLMVYIGIILAAAMLWRGAGIVLAAFSLVMWFAIPLVRWVRATFSTSSLGPRANWPRATAVLAGSTCAMVLLAVCIPWPAAPASPAVVDYAPLWVLRAPTNAWIERLLVRSGQHVEQGQPLAVLRNDELELQVARLDVEIQRAELAVRRSEQEKRRADVQAEFERLTALRKQRAELEGQRELLSVRAPVAGRVVSPRLGERLGTYVRQGEELLQIGNDRRKEILLATTQDELHRLSHRLGRPVRVAVPGGGSFPGRLERVKPRASTRPLHPALTAVAGGPLTVQRSQAATGHEPQDGMELLQPHFEAVVPLHAAAAESLAAGQTVTVYLNADRDSLGRRLVDAVTGWFRVRAQ